MFAYAMEVFGGECCECGFASPRHVFVITILYVAFLCASDQNLIYKAYAKQAYLSKPQ
jgi:hypothetical protein